MSISIRLERPDETRAVEELTREAFWGYTAPTCDEHYLVHILRSAECFIPSLDFVAEIDGALAGNVIYTKAGIVSPSGERTEIITFGPLSVLPRYWNHGVGSALMLHSIAEAKRQGHKAIVFYGHPDYYPRFGFSRAKEYGITSPGGNSFDALMAMPLYDGALDGISGAFHEDAAFHINSADAEAFNLTFPHKEPAQMVPIDVLLDRLSPAARGAFTSRGITVLAWLNRSSGREMLDWEGMDRQSMAIVSQTLLEHGISPKVLP